MYGKTLTNKTIIKKTQFFILGSQVATNIKKFILNPRIKIYSIRNTLMIWEQFSELKFHN